MEQEQKETLIKVADYSKCKEKNLLRKVIAIGIIGFLAWTVSFAFVLWFINSAKGAGFLMISELIALILYGIGMLCVKTNRTVSGYLNTVIGAAIAVVVSNIALLIIFFGSGSYHNYGLAGAYYFLLTLLAVFAITGITASIVGRKGERR